MTLGHDAGIRASARTPVIQRPSSEVDGAGARVQRVSSDGDHRDAESVGVDATGRLDAQKATIGFVELTVRRDLAEPPAGHERHDLRVVHRKHRRTGLELDAEWRPDGYASHGNDERSPTGSGNVASLAARPQRVDVQRAVDGDIGHGRGRGVGRTGVGDGGEHCERPAADGASDDSAKVGVARRTVAEIVGGMTAGQGGFHRFIIRQDRWMVHGHDVESLARSSGVLDERATQGEPLGVIDSPMAPAIGTALRFLRMSGIFYCPSEFSEPWGVSLPAIDDCAWFHVVTSGSATIEVDGATLSARAGDLIVVPHGNGHRAWGVQQAPTPSVVDLPHDYISESYAVLRHGGGGDRTDVVCGGVRFDHPAAQHLIQALPGVIHIEGSRSPRSDWMHATLGLMADEVSTVRAGGDAVVSRLCDIVIIQAIRAWIERDPAARTGWLGALRDPQIGAAIALIHTLPMHEWTVASLAAEVAMSRSTFAARFRDLVGEPVMQYLTRWRMFQALDLLETTDSTVAAAGQAAGYESEAAFSRAFTRTMGATPSAARARGRSSRMRSPVLM